MTSLNLYSCRSPYLDDAKVYPPLGLLYLKAAINQSVPNVNVNLIDDYKLDGLEGIAKQADWHGISIMTPQREEARNLRDTIRKFNPKAKIIAGGPHALHYFSEVEKEDWDFVVPSDGQISVAKILQGGTDRVVIDKLNPIQWGEQPRPDRLSLQARTFLLGYHYSLEGKKSTTMLTATGCSEKCKFCEDAMTSVRWSPLEKITRELDDIKQLGYQGIYLFDDLFAIAMKKVKPICDELNKRGFVYRCNGQARYFTMWGEDFAKMLAETGCREIAFGHETGSQVILNNINKRTTIEQNYDSVKYAKKHGIKVKSFILLGLPGETRETLKDTERFVATAGMDDFQCAIYYPYRGTQIREALERRDADLDMVFQGEGLGAYGQKGGNTESVVGTKALSSQELLDFRNYLVETYKPLSHKERWNRFHDTHLATQVEY